MKRDCALWRRAWYWVITGVYFERMTVINPQQLPQTGPVLYLGLHRNGAVDGFVYHQALAGPTFMISSQLRRNWLAKLFFDGIVVTRTKDEGDRSSNTEALQQCLEHLRAGASLFVFPEGTSSLGPRHLPFKSGAIWMILEYLEKCRDRPLQVIPVGIHYECPWAFRAKVEVVLGKAVDLALADGLSTLAKLKELKRRAQTGLEEVGINVASVDYQERVQRLGYVATLATPRSYFRSTKALENRIPDPILQEETGLTSALKNRRLLFHQRVPLVPMGPVLIYTVALIILAPIVGSAMFLNAPPLIAGWFAGKRFPDDVNVISLWKILVGLPSFLIWVLLVLAVCVVCGKPFWFVFYAALTWAGLRLYYRVKKLVVAVHNGLLYPALKPAMLHFRETVIHALPDEQPSD
jgi:1-acyl-sn-glycerol-3-phosphate acyltransferase